MVTNLIVIYINVHYKHGTSNLISIVITSKKHKMDAKITRHISIPPLSEIEAVNVFFLNDFLMVIN